MGRGRKNYEGKAKYVAINLSANPELTDFLDQWCFSNGLDSRSQAAAILLKMAISAVPAETMVHEVVRASMQQMRNAEFEALARFFDERARLYAESRR